MRENGNSGVDEIDMTRCMKESGRRNAVEEGLH